MSKDRTARWLQDATGLSYMQCLTAVKHARATVSAPDPDGEHDAAWREAVWAEANRWLSERYGAEPAPAPASMVAAPRPPRPVAAPAPGLFYDPLSH